MRESLSINNTLESALSSSRSGVVVIQTVGTDSLPELVKIHLAAFTRSALTTLGIQAVQRYYDWQLTGPHELTALGAFIDNRMAGFCLAGAFHGALSGFLEKNRSFLVSRVLSHPWLLFNPIVRSRLSAGRKSLTTLVKPKRSLVHSESPRPRCFGILVIAVEPRQQGSGVGRLLMKNAENAAINRGFPEMRLSVQTDNHQAVRFYEGLRWEKILGNGVWNGEMKKVPGFEDRDQGYCSH